MVWSCLLLRARGSGAESSSSADPWYALFQITNDAITYQEGAYSILVM